MSARILVVDDEPSLLRLIAYVLETEGYETITASSGMEALDQVQTGQPDLVILDVMLPDISGIDVCQQLRDKPETALLPIIMLSARTQVTDKIRGLQAGADEYVTKPIDADEIVARVAALLARTRRLRQAERLRRGEVLSFIGAKGGVGTTTVALNVASALAQQQGKTVIAVEFRSHYGTFSAQLGCAPTRNLGSLLELDPERMNERELAARLTDFSPGLQVLFGPQKFLGFPNEFGEMEASQAKAVIKGLAGMADYTIVDLPCHPCAASQAAMGRSDGVILVVEPEPTSLIAGRVTLEVVKSWGVSGRSVGAVVVNRLPSASAMESHDIGSRLGCQIVGVVPPATEACLAAQQQGAPLVLCQPHNIAAVKLTEIANRLIDDRGIAMMFS